LYGDRGVGRCWQVRRLSPEAVGEPSPTHPCVRYIAIF
jgi:hypothetical protein